MKVAIVGAGWYGCHTAISLLQKGDDVTVFERGERAISGASRYNQNRLHQGFHYPRDYETRKQSLEGFDWFIEHYGNLVADVENNYYAVANKLSNIDFETFKQIMTASDLEYCVESDGDVFNKFTKISGLIKTSEKLVLNHKASAYFDDVLSKHIRYNCNVELSDKNIMEKLKSEFDFVIDCTWGTARKIKDLEYYYEPCIYFYYRKKTKGNFAFTLMDGNFFSIYPYDDDIYTVTSVLNTPIDQVNNRGDIEARFSLAKDKSYIENKKIAFEEEIRNYYPKFKDDFEYVEPVYSLKTKLVSGSDFRGCIVTNEDNLISVFSGKIDTLHIAELKINQIMESAR